MLTKPLGSDSMSWMLLIDFVVIVAKERNIIGLLFLSCVKSVENIIHSSQNREEFPNYFVVIETIRTFGVTLR